MARLSIAIQGGSKMHRTEVDLVLAACALDELSCIDGQPSETVMPIVTLGAAELPQDADRVLDNSIASLGCPGICRPWHCWNDTRELRDRLAANDDAIPSWSALARPGEQSRARMPHANTFQIDQRFGE
ncbi:hypothetical protein ACQPTN_05980 [Bradyrhizobium sp. 13971]